MCVYDAVILGLGRRTLVSLVYKPARPSNLPVANVTCGSVFTTPLLSHNLAVTCSSLRCLDLHLESDSRMVSPPATMPATASSCLPSSYSSRFLLPTPRHPPAVTAPPSRRASTTDPPASRRGRGASCDAAPPASCPRRCRTGELCAAVTPVSSAPPRAPCAATDLRVGVELCNEEPPFVQAAR
jgi:hypothetical protein